MSFFIRPYFFIKKIKKVMSNKKKKKSQSIRIKCAKCLVFSAKHHKPYSITCTKDHKKEKKNDMTSDAKNFGSFLLNSRSLSLSLSLIIIKGQVNECRTVLVKNSFQESFYITFMGNKKSYQNINCFFTFFHKNFL